MVPAPAFRYVAEEGWGPEARLFRKSRASFRGRSAYYSLRRLLKSFKASKSFDFFASSSSPEAAFFGGVLPVVTVPPVIRVAEPAGVPTPPTRVAEPTGPRVSEPNGMAGVALGARVSDPPGMGEAGTGLPGAGLPGAGAGAPGAGAPGAGAGEPGAGAGAPGAGAGEPGAAGAGEPGAGEPGPLPGLPGPSASGPTPAFSNARWTSAGSAPAGIRIRTRSRTRGPSGTSTVGATTAGATSTAGVTARLAAAKLNCTWNLRTLSSIFRSTKNSYSSSAVRGIPVATISGVASAGIGAQSHRTVPAGSVSRYSPGCCR